MTQGTQQNDLKPEDFDDILAALGRLDDRLALLESMAEKAEQAVSNLMGMLDE